MKQFVFQTDFAAQLDGSSSLKTLSEQAGPLYQRLSGSQQVSVLSALAVVAVAAGFLVLFTFACGRIARWYVNRRPAARGCDVPRRDVELLVDRKPRPRSKEHQRWHQPH